VSGYVVDEATGERLKNVSVYDPLTFSSTVTNKYGYFEMKVEKPSPDIKLSVNKENYGDTVVTLAQDSARLLHIPMRINTAKLETFADSLGRKLKRFWKTKILISRNPNLQNIRDTLYRTTQFSVVPFIGTNHKLSGNVINDFSFNLFGGYALGVRRFEMGGVFNIDRGDVQGVQLAGVLNATGGKVKALQLAGLFNANYDTAEAVQLAGLINFNWGSIRGFTGAGVMNITREDSRALQMAGVANITAGNQKGPQFAGVFNIVTKDAGPLQMAGVYNVSAGDMRGIQIGGVFNVAAKKMKGAQIAPVFNYGRNVKGAQIGLINISDSIQGIPLGLLSFSNHGYHKIEIAADEIFYTNIAFRTGVHQLYNIFTAGAKPDTFEGDSTYWTFGYGIGTAPKITRWLSMNFDITTNQIVDRKKIEEINLLNKLYIGFDVQLLKKMSLTFGATLNGYVTKTGYDGYSPLFTRYEPNIIYDKNFNDLNLKMWWGAKVGLRFL
jgi:hypothetical protein